MDHIYWRTLNSAERIRYSWARYGDFPIFRKDLRQLLSPCYQEAAQIEDYFEPWERRARRYGEGFDMDVLMRADLETYLARFPDGRFAACVPAVITPHIHLRFNPCASRGRQIATYDIHWLFSLSSKALMMF